MKSPWRNRKNQAFTLVEMLVVIAIIAVLAALLLPALLRGKQRALRIECVGNLKEIGTAFQIFAHDHHGRFPMEISTAEGGSQEYVQAGNNINGPFYFSYRHLQTLGNEMVVPRLLVCPADTAREPAPSFGALQNSNVSYFVGVFSDPDVPTSILAGDRNITNEAGSTESLVRSGVGLRWTRELHLFKGNVLFSDSHVEQMNNEHIEVSPGYVYVLPTVKSDSPGSPTTVAISETPGTTPGMVMPQRSPSDIVAPGAAAPNAPAPQMPMPFRQGMSSSAMTAPPGSNTTTFVETTAKETSGDAAFSAAKPTAAPAANNDDEAPSLRLLASAGHALAGFSWWLWLLLALLIAIAAYILSRRTKRRPASRQSNLGGRKFYFREHE
jgi:prepilin-type N-terminal cleavage/methylation domain-containing protein